MDTNSYREKETEVICIRIDIEYTMIQCRINIYICMSSRMQ